MIHRRRVLFLGKKDGQATQGLPTAGEWLLLWRRPTANDKYHPDDDDPPPSTTTTPKRRPSTTRTTTSKSKEEVSIIPSKQLGWVQKVCTPSKHWGFSWNEIIIL
mmetsp:Transcript_10990/g.30380  ORF Transcript_10990/g.30380 Transcript_10990/m.30380 type:complete len:105 (-) Transcript_10990:339-653(-)